MSPEAAAMQEIVLIDDDYSAGILAEQLTFRGFQVRRFTNASDAIGAVGDFGATALVILDIIMERPESTDSTSISGDQTTGMLILRAIRDRFPELPVLVFSGVRDNDLIAALRRSPHTTFMSRWGTPSLSDLIQTVEQIVGVSHANAAPTSFIVHGHDSVSKLELKNFLQNTLGFPEPIILHEQATHGRTIIEKFENYATNSTLAFVLLTPDDRFADGAATNDEKWRARQNVIFELGYFFASLGRLSGRVLLLHKGPLDLPSDISGLVHIDISNGVAAAGETIRRELSHVIRF
jgi:hypothetical protein